MLVKNYDVLVIGSGAAGLGLALCLAETTQVAVLCKEDLLTSSSQHAQGGIAAVMSQEDSYESHINDTLQCGAGLCDPVTVEYTVKQAKPAIQWLIERGVEFTSSANAKFHLTQEGGHSHRRILHAADKTGEAVVRTLAQQVLQHPNIDCFTEHTSLDLLVENNTCYGAMVLDNRTSTISMIQAHFIVLATGGASRVYLHTSNPGHTTGDGMAIAYRAGARLANMEFNQFHPTCFYDPRGKTFLITEAMRGEGAKLILPNGQRFMDKYDIRGELASRDIVARAIDHELKSRNLSYVLLDISHEKADRIKKSFPTIYQLCLERGIDITQSPIPVVPAAHYTCGGIITNLQGQTDISGLFAIGEVACTGLHGANRMASNSLLECLVFAKSAAQAIQEKLKRTHQKVRLVTSNYRPDKTETHLDEINGLTFKLRALVWDYVGLVRSNERLQVATHQLKQLEQSMQSLWERSAITKELIELRNLILNAKLILASAISRHESRGIHYTVDYPKMLTKSQNSIILPQKEPDEIIVQHASNIHSLIAS